MPSPWLTWYRRFAGRSPPCTSSRCITWSWFRRIRSRSPLAAKRCVPRFAPIICQGCCRLSHSPRTRRRRRMRHWLRHLLFLGFYRLITLLPKCSIASVSAALARLSVAFGLRRHVIRTNLDIAFGSDIGPAELEQLYRDNLRSLWLTFIEILWMARHDREEIRQQASISGWELVEQALAQGRGALILGGHLGNWELHNAVLALAAKGRYYSYTGRQNNPRSERFMTRLRTRAGVQPVSRAPEATRRMIQVLKDNCLMGICADQNANRAP